MTSEIAPRVPKIYHSIDLEKPIKGLDPEYLRYAAWRVLRLNLVPESHLTNLHPYSLRVLLDAEQTLAGRVLSQPAAHSSADVADAILLDRMQHCSPLMRETLASVWFARQVLRRGTLALDISEELFQNPGLLTS